MTEAVHRARRRQRGSAARPVELGLRQNRRQFWLLVLVNAFVGSMVGLERAVLPLLAESEFGLASASATLSFIASFGLVKALTSLVAGRLGDRWGRRRVLLAGWLFALPVPWLIIAAPTWSWIVAANVLLGASQGLAWSTTVVMKIDLVGPRRRGFAMGLNEFAGYLAVALTVLATGYIAEAYGLRPAPFYLGAGIAAAGLALTLMFVRDTRGHVELESRLSGTTAASATPSSTSRTGLAGATGASVTTSPSIRSGITAATSASAATSPGMRTLLADSAWRNPALATASHAGLINNLNDGMAWGLFPLFFAAAGLPVAGIGILAFLYPATWAVVQLGAGAWSDRVGRKPLIAWGMTVQGIALLAIAGTTGFGAWAGGAVLLGIGTALVYPTLLAAVGDVAHPSWRASAVGAYRMWRDGGYVVGALGAGVIADRLGMRWAIAVVGLVTLASGLLVALRMPETLGMGGGTIEAGAEVAV